MKNGFVVVTDVTKLEAGQDVAEALQNIIDDNPNRTIYFPDGEYLISKPLLLPAAHEKSVSLKLSNYAVIRVSDEWSSDEAMIRLGGKDPENDNFSVGSNYGIDGGVLDGKGVAKGISIDSGRETMIKNVAIKNTPVGIHIKYGANWGSSDADISSVNIVGTGKPDSIGILVEGWDNTFTNIRIANVFIGVKLCSSGNMLRNVHPLYTSDDYYEYYQQSYGFWAERGSNWFDYCYSDQFANAFYTTKDVDVICHNCFAFWYSSREKAHVAFKTEGKFDSIVTNYRIGFKDLETENAVLLVGEDGGNGMIQNLKVNEELVTDNTHLKYMKER